MKKIVIALVILLVVAACSNNSNTGNTDNGNTGNGSNGSNNAAVENFNETGYPIVPEKITLEMMGSKNAIHGPWEEMHLFTEMEKMTNISFKFNTPPQDSYEERKNLSFASMELPDVFFGGKLSKYDEMIYGGQGILIPLNDLIDKYAPNIKKLLDENPDIRGSITTPDGNIYSLPRVNTVPRDMTTKMWIYQVWLDELGLDMPTTTEEYYNVLKAFKEKDPNGNGQADEIPLSSNNKMQDIKGTLLGAFGYLGSNPVNVQEDKVVYYPVQDGYQEYLKFMNRLWAEDLIDKDSYAQTAQEFTAKGKNMVLGSYVHAGPHVVVPTDNALDYPVVPPLTSEFNDKKMWPKSSNIENGAFAITNQNEHPEATMRWIDYLYSDEGTILASYGIEGTDWKWSDNSEYWERILPEEGMNPEEYRGGKVTPQAGTTIATIWNADFVLKQDSVFGRHIDSGVEEQYMDYWQIPFPQTYFTEEQEKRINVIESDLDTYIEQMEAKFITGAEPFSKWEDYVKTIERMGLAELVDIYQEAYDTWKSNL